MKGWEGHGADTLWEGNGVERGVVVSSLLSLYYFASDVVSFSLRSEALLTEVNYPDGIAYFAVPTVRKNATPNFQLRCQRRRSQRIVFTAIPTKRKQTNIIKVARLPILRPKPSPNPILSLEAQKQIHW